MESLVRLEEALLENDGKGVESYLAEIDRKTANDCMRLMGEALGFQTVGINGMLYAHLGRASLIMGYTDPSSLAQLLNAYRIMTPKIGWFEEDARTRIRKELKLNPKDSQATFILYEGLLIVGMQGQTEGAKKIKLYLLKMENAARVGIVTSADRLKADSHKIKVLEKQINLASKVVRMQDGPFKDLAVEALEQLTGKKLPRSAQMELLKTGSGNGK